MTAPLRPDDPKLLADMLATLVADRRSVEIVGSATKRSLGRPVEADHVLALDALSGIELYEPEELVLSAMAGTPLRLIESALATHRQELAFEPIDYGPLLGGEPGGGTVAGAVACNLSGPRRLKAGAARDHMLGFTAVSGRGETFKSGGRVVKNVTGYDLSKLMCGSFGTLAVMDRVTIKVLPAAETSCTLRLSRLADATALRALAMALASPHEVSGAAHLPRGADGAGDAETLVRLEGFGPSVAARSEALRSALGKLGEIDVIDAPASQALWRSVRDVLPFVSEPGRPVWRVSTAPSQGAAFVASLPGELEAEALYDWGGGLIWLRLAQELEDAGAASIRRTLAGFGGHATLVRADRDTRARIDVLHPQPPGVSALTRRVKQGFDPHGVLNPGRMWAGL